MSDEEVVQPDEVLQIESAENVIEIDDPEIRPLPVEQLSPQEQSRLADHIINEIDDHPEGIPQLPLDLNMLYVWSIEPCFLPPTSPGEDAEPGLIITSASPTNPRGTPVFILNRDRALKLASQIKKFANTGPSLQQRAAQSGLAVPPSPAEGKLIVPGR